jgi:putative oxygen-independent coproporphyrinogen III oxidase
LSHPAASDGDAAVDLPAAPGFGVYVHVPFCRHRCDYCAFATWTDRSHLAGRYLDACRRQVGDGLRCREIPPVTSVFVGGGTPSLVPPAALLAVWAEAPLVSGAEVTIECNPDDVTPELIRAYVDGGVTRLSFGVQSMVPAVLASLGRRHDPDSVWRAADAAHRAGVPFSVDVVYGAVDESLDDWAATLDAALALEPGHVSAYALTVEPGTPLAADPRRHPDDDYQADAYLLADERLGAAGFAWYEISNWARPGQRCRHNLLYWRQGDYLAVGCAAHGHRAGRRTWNLRTPERYIDAVEAGRSVEAGGEDVVGPTRELERLQLALRTEAGVPAGAFTAEDRAVLADLLDEPAPGGRLRLTRRGRLLANEVALRLTVAGSPAATRTGSELHTVGPSPVALDDGRPPDPAGVTSAAARPRATPVDDPVRIGPPPRSSGIGRTASADCVGGPGLSAAPDGQGRGAGAGGGAGSWKTWPG